MLALLLFAAYAHAEVPDAQLIYEALNVQPTHHEAFEHWWDEKSVGGLICSESHEGYPGAAPTYSCDLDVTLKDDAAIYNALNVRPVAINPGIAGKSGFAKEVGSLTCTRRELITPAPVEYSCTLK